MVAFFNQFARFGPKLILSLGLFLIFWLGGLIFQFIIRRVSIRKELNQDFLNLMGKTAKISMIVFGLVTALGTLGINISALVAGLGLTGFALGFALKDIISNLIAGVMIILYRPFKPNDQISVAGFEGIVVTIDLRYTVIQTEDKKVLIPNSTLFKKEICLINSD